METREAIQQRIHAYFAEHKDEMIQDICTLVQIQSDKQPPVGDMPFGEGPAKALAAALNIAQNMGFETRNYDHYAGTVNFGSKEAGLDILAHLDVVPAGDSWTVTAPFEPIVRDGKIYGRGTSDDKGPAVAALYAMKAVKDLGFNLDKNVRLILGTDEECGSACLEHYFKFEKSAPCSFSPDSHFPVINTEKGGLVNEFSAQYPCDTRLPRILSVESGVKINVVPHQAVAVVEGFTPPVLAPYFETAAEDTGIRFSAQAQKGQTTITASGKGAHASTPEDGNNALTGLLSLLCRLPFADSEGFQKLCALNRLYPHGDYAGKALGIAMQDEISGALTISLDLLKADDTGFNGSDDCRAPVCANDQNVTAVIEKTMAAQGIEVKPAKMLLSHHVAETSPFVQTLLHCYEQYTGEKGACLAVGGRTYVHEIENGVAFGCVFPGTETHMHGADEFMAIEELVLGAEIFTQVILDVCKAV